MKRYWKTRDKRKLLISKMETSHIQNCIKFLENLNEKHHNFMLYSAISFQSTLQGELAIDAMDDVIDDMAEGRNTEQYNFPGADEFIESFEHELDKRRKNDKTRMV